MKINLFLSFPGSHRDSTFDVAFSNTEKPYEMEHDTDTLGELCRILRPSSKIFLQELVSQTSESSKWKTKENFVSTLKLSGFVDISVVNNLI